MQLEYRSLGVAEEKIFIARNAAAHKPASAPPIRPPAFTANRAGLLFVGRLQERKRVDLLLQACAALPENLQPELTIVGDGPERSRLQDLARQIYPRAKFTGSLTGEPLEALFRSADLFVLPGTGGLAVQQAMSHALPVIVAEADGTQADLVRPENGWTLIPGDPDSLQNTLREALENPARLRQMGQKSYEIVRDEINLEQMAASFMQAVLSVWKGDK